MRMPLVMMVVLLVLSAFVDAYIFYDIRTYSKERFRRLFLGMHVVSAILCWALIITLMCIPIRDGGQSLMPVMWMLYTYLSIYIAKAIYVVFSLIGRLIAKFAERRGTHRRVRNYGIITGVPVALLSFILMWWGVFFTRYDIEVNKVDVYSSKLPAAFEGYRIVQFSDAHVGTWGTDTTFISSLVKKINALNPDVIVFTGDIVNRETSEIEPFVTVLSRLNARDGVYSILGNHDYGDYRDWKFPEERETNNILLAGWQKQMGWKLLNNEHDFIVNGNDSIVMIGVENWGEPPFAQYGKFTDAYPASADSSYNLNDNRFKVLLTHNPEHWRREVTRISNVDLSLSGHTHAMQMMLRLGSWKWSPAAFKYQNWGGLYETQSKNGEKMNLYVNIGCGEVAMPSRIGAAYPEITEITLHRDSTDSRRQKK